MVLWQFVEPRGAILMKTETEFVSHKYNNAATASRRQASNAAAIPNDDERLQFVPPCTLCVPVMGTILYLAREVK